MGKLIKKIKNIKWTKKKIAILCISLLLLIALITTLIIVLQPKKNNEEKPVEEIKQEVKEEPKVTIVDVNSKSRPYAVMINNHPTARLYHSGLQDAYIVYELIVEGGMTRYMAVFKDQNTAKIGSVRSARHYFLDYAMENDAYYTHWGWSPQAEGDIKTLGINNINGLIYSGTYFYRENLNVSMEHTGFTTMEMLNKAVDKLGYRKETNKKLLLNYTPNKVELNNMENSQKADEVTIKYSNSVVDKYVYDEENGYYLRFVNGKEHKDYPTGKQYHFKNIITYQVSNSSIAGDDKGRQDFNNTGSGEGYYITNGYAIKIKWSKSKRDEQTKYTYLDGKEIDVSDGNTFIQIQPTGQGLNIVSNEKQEVEKTE